MKEPTNGKNRLSCEFDWKAPNFELPSTDDKLYTRDSLLGEKGLLIMFICNHCPYVLSALDRILEVALELSDKGIGIAAISSNDVQTYPLDSFENMKKLADTNSFPFPYLFDESQEVAKTYRAQCTPDFFGFNEFLGLQYRGRLDSGGRDIPKPGSKRELYEAMLKVSLTGRGPREQTPSIGCSIKWKNL
tara:strand:+ start:1300 stop:1869 length:570 start_codon:yes stop_codon:yes gene_type:complete